MASRAKFQVMNSMIGRSPTIARPRRRRRSRARDRRVDDAHLAELGEQPLRDLVGAVVDGHLLAHEEDAVVALHLLAQRLVERVAVRDDGHRCQLVVSASTSR
jgi:hypothetical protein